MAAQSLVASQSLPEVTFAFVSDSWNLPEPTSYGHACELGRQYAAKVIDFLKCTPGAAGANIIGRMASQVDFSRQDDGRGVWIGFFAQLEVVLRDAARYSAGMKNLVGELPPEPEVEPVGVEIESDEAPLIDVREGEIGGIKMNVVDGRELHAFLCVGTLFKDWIKRRINDFDFTQDVDFVGSILSLDDGGDGKMQYHLSLDMAKELSMVERNAKGKQARQYFIECERKLLAGMTTQPQVPQTLSEALRLAADLADENRTLRDENATLRAGRNAVSYTQPRTRNALVQTA